MSEIVAAIQMTSSLQLQTNLQQAEKYITEAAEKGAKLVVLPEMWATMVMGQTEKIALAEAEGDGPIQAFMAQQAQQHGIWLVGGTIPLQSEDPGKVRAASFIYTSEGIVAARYDKVHLFDVTVETGKEEYVESAVTEAGDEVIILDTPVGRLGMAVCYDIRFPELFRVMFRHGVEIFCIPSAFTVPTGQAHWEVLARARAIENLSYVVAACQYGEHDTGRVTYGGSCVIDPWGQVVANQTEGTGVITAAIDLDYLTQVRSNMPVQQHLKITEI